MSRRSTTLSAPATPKDEDVFMFDQADEFLDGRSTGSMDNVELKVKEAQEQLLQLRHQSEELERQKLHLEQLRIRQDRFVTGKRDLTDKLSRSVTMLERELYDAQKLVEELSITKDSFNRHLETLRSLQPEKWQRSNVDEELDRALSAVEDAVSEYAKGTRRVAAARPAEMQSIEIEDGRAPQNSVMADDDASTWMRRGFAFTLPLMGTILLTLVLAKLMF